MATEVVYFFTPLILLFIPEHCHDEFLVKFNFFDVSCLKIAVSKGFGVGIIAGSVMVKVPQILKLVKASSGVGLSIPALLAEMTALTFSMSYAVHKNFPFSSWGESLFLSIQDTLLVVLVFYYAKSYIASMSFGPFYVGISYVLCSKLTPMPVAEKLQEVTLIVILVSRFLQIWESFSNGHTGQLSFITQVLLAGGSLTRVFTTIQETGDTLMVSQFILACSLNCLILGQILWYWNVSLTVEKEKKAE